MTTGRHRQWSLGKTLYKRSHKCNKTPVLKTQRSHHQTGGSADRPWTLGTVQREERATATEALGLRTGTRPRAPPSACLGSHTHAGETHLSTLQTRCLGPERVRAADCCHAEPPKAGGRLGRQSFELTTPPHAVLLQQPCQLLLSSLIFPREQITTWMLNTLK